MATTPIVYRLPWRITWRRHLAALGVTMALMLAAGLVLATLAGGRLMVPTCNGCGAEVHPPAARPGPSVTVTAGER